MTPEESATEDHSNKKVRRPLRENGAVVTSLVRLSSQKWFQNLMFKGEAERRSLLAPALSDGLISYQDYEFAATYFQKWKKAYYFQYYNIGPMVLASPFLALRRKAIKNPAPVQQLLRFSLPVLAFGATAYYLSAFTRTTIAFATLPDFWENLENPLAVAEVIRNVKLKSIMESGGIPSGQIYSAEFTPDTVEPSPNETEPLPTSPSSPFKSESAANNASRWDELRAASNKTTSASTWDDIRQKHERPQTPGASDEAKK